MLVGTTAKVRQTGVLVLVLAVSATVAGGLVGCKDSQRDSSVSAGAVPHGRVENWSTVQGESAADAIAQSLVVLHPVSELPCDSIPFQDAMHADFIVVTDIGEPIEKTLLALKVVKILKGEVPPGRLALRHESSASTKFPPITHGLDLAPGVRIGICVSRGKDGIWWATEVRRLTQLDASEMRLNREERWIRETTRFLAVLDAGRSEDPAKRYRELLPLDSPILLDLPAYTAIQLGNDPHAVDTLCAMLEKVAKDPPWIGSGDCATVEYLMRLIGAIGDVRAVDPAIRAIEVLPAGDRWPVYRRLPVLTKNAKPETVRRVLRLVQTQLDQLPDGIELKNYSVQDVGTVEFKLSRDHVNGTAACRELKHQLAKWPGPYQK